MDKAAKNTILIIDDEPANIITLRHMLGPDYTIYGVTEGLSGITAAKLQKPDVILLDIIMPGMDGYEVLAHLKSTEETQDIPVIIVTQLSNEESEEKGLILGAEDYIQKPFSSLIVKLRVKNMLKVVTRNHRINKLMQQQALLKSISYSILTESDVNSLIVDSLCKIGELMDLSHVCLYKISDDSSSLICQSEWSDPDHISETDVGYKQEQNAVLVQCINDLLIRNEGDLCLHSNDKYVKNIIEPYRNNSHSFITVPIFKMGDICAVIDLSSDDDGRIWSENELTFIVMVANALSGIYNSSS